MAATGFSYLITLIQIKFEKELIGMCLWDSYLYFVFIMIIEVFL